MAAYPPATDGETEGGNSETFSYVVGKLSDKPSWFLPPCFALEEEGRPVGHDIMALV